jgi:hypothetical protein
MSDNKEKLEKMTISQKEIKEKMKSLFGKPDEEQPVCGAPLSSCECGYKFIKEETQCPVCKKDRGKCKKKAVIGSKKCGKHGGNAGRPIEVDEDGVPKNYEGNTKQKKMKRAIQHFEDYIEIIGEKCINILDQIEGIVEANKDETGGEYNIDDLILLLDKGNNLFKNLVQYGKMRSGQRLVEVTNEQMDHRMEWYRQMVTNQCFAIAVNNFLEVLRQNIKNDNLIKSMLEGLAKPLKEAYKKQAAYFKNAKDAAREFKPEVIEVKPDAQ